MPSWLKAVIIAVLSLALPWLRSTAPVAIVTIVEEILAFLQTIPAEQQDKALADLLQHIKLKTQP